MKSLEERGQSPWVGQSGPLLIAEIGGNHEGDYGYALRLLELAIESGADVIKFQVYRGDTLVSPVESPDRNRHFKKFELTIDQYRGLAEQTIAAGRIFMASVWDLDMLDALDEFMPIYKVGSGDLTAYPLLEVFASRGKPIILSTGLATMKDVTESVDFIRRVNPDYEGGGRLAVLQCTSMYPIPAGDANLSVMQSLGEGTSATIGYSDHTVGSEALAIAVAMGAQVLEFHFTDSREGKSFRDHQVSLTAAEVQSLAGRIRSIRELQGHPEKIPLAVEGDHVTTFRRAAYLRRDMAAGSVVSADDIVVLRPNHGIDARRVSDLVGRTLLRDALAFSKLDWSMFDGDGA